MKFCSQLSALISLLCECLGIDRHRNSTLNHQPLLNFYMDTQGYIGIFIKKVAGRYITVAFMVRGIGHIFLNLPKLSK